MEPPLYGNLLAGKVHGMNVLHLWPYDYSESSRVNSVKPLATLWKPELSTVLHAEMAYTGLERVPQGNKAKWVVQRWICEPVTYEKCKAAGAPKAQAQW